MKNQQLNKTKAREGYVTSGTAQLYYRDIGSGKPIIVLHGGPDFDHSYLLPDMDRLSDKYRLIYYDQRCRGKSKGTLNKNEISVMQYARDLDEIRKHMLFKKSVIMGHSWGAHLALHYAINFPENVSRMILLNTAPASYDDAIQTRDNILKKRAPHENRIREILSSREYQRGEPGRVNEYYMLIYGTSFKDPEDLKRLNLNLKKDDIIRGREIEDQLVKDLYWAKGFTLIPQLKKLNIPTLVIYGSNDFIPQECSIHIAEAIPNAKLVTIPDSGHFSYIDANDQVINALDDFFNSSG